MKDRIEQTINRLKKDLETLSFKASEILAEKGEYIRDLNGLINKFEQEKAFVENQMNALDEALDSLNQTELEKRAQLKILEEI